MVSKLTQRPIRSPGQLVINPTVVSGRLAGAYPHGGTVVGYTTGGVLSVLGQSAVVEMESLGEVGDVLESSNRWGFSAFIRGWDDDAVRLLMPGNHETGEISGHSVFAVPGTRSPGQTTYDRSVRMLFAPDDRIAGVGVLAFRGVPDWSESAQVAFERGSELGIPLFTECLRDTDNRTLRIGRLADL